MHTPICCGKGRTEPRKRRTATTSTSENGNVEWGSGTVAEPDVRACGDKEDDEDDDDEEEVL